MENRFFKYYVLTLAIAISLMAAFSGCKKDDINTSPDVKLSFSTDSVNFDTVFNTVGTATYLLKVYNTDDSYVNISRIKLNNDQNNSYRINVDGLPGSNFTDTEIGPDDSLFVFIEVTVTPDANVLYPFVEGDITFTTNGNEQKVELVAWGWDAIFYVPTDFPTNGLPDFSLIDEDTLATVTWTADKPIVVYGYVVVDEKQKLIIEPGAQIFFHQGAGLWVYAGGEISAVGTLENPIVFQGDRLEPFYDEQPGQWDRIWLNESPTNHVFEHCVIKNNFIGIQAQSDPFFDGDLPLISTNKLKLKNVAIRNNSIASILSENYRVEGENVLLSRAGQYLLAGTGGGSYNFKQCTFGNNWNLTVRQTPAVFITNYVQLDATQVGIGDIDPSEFENCIIYGNGFNELGFDLNTEKANVDLTFDHCLIRGEEEELTPYIEDYFDTVFVGNDPGFVDFSGGDFRLRSDAFVIGQGKNLSSPSSDLIGTSYNNPRPLGCFEFLK